MAVTRHDEIITMGEVLSRIGKGTTATDAEIGQLQLVKVGAEAAIRRFLRINVTQDTYTRYYPKGNPYDRRRATLGSQLVLEEMPLRSITSIYEDDGGYFGQVAGSYASTTQLTEGSDYYWQREESDFSRAAIITRRNTEWPADPGSIKVTFVAGWTEAELHGNVSSPIYDASEIRDGLMRTIAEHWNDMKQAQSGQGGSGGAIKAERLADYSVEYDTAVAGQGIQIPKDVKIALRKYRRLVKVI